jgi:hypothetical protein
MFGIEVDVRVLHRFHGAVVGEQAVFHLAAAGLDRRFDRVGVMGMHDGTQPLSFGLAAHGIDLFLRHVHLAAVADAAGREELDDIGAVGLQRADLFPELLRRPRAALDLAE